MCHKPIPVVLGHVDEHAALITLAHWEFRTPAEQAAQLIVEGLRARGLLAARPYAGEREAQGNER